MVTQDGEAYIENNLSGSVLGQALIVAPIVRVTIHDLQRAALIEQTEFRTELVQGNPVFVPRDDGEGEAVEGAVEEGGS